MSSPMAPQRLPGRLYAAFHAVGLEWPDLPLERYAALARTAGEAGSRLVDGTAAGQLAAQARVLETFAKTVIAGSLICRHYRRRLRATITITRICWCVTCS